MPGVTVRKRVVVSGRVQGVWFRESCRQEADARRVAGWVRNRPDGKVEAVFEGEPQSVDELVGWCEIGPMRARVVRVEVIEELPVGESGFAVR